MKRVDITAPKPTSRSVSGLVRMSSRANNWIFVGRIVPHKRQHELVEVFAKYTKNCRSHAKLFIVGGIGDDDYLRMVQQSIESNQVADRIRVTGSWTTPPEISSAERQSFFCP